MVENRSSGGGVVRELRLVPPVAWLLAGLFLFFWYALAVPLVLRSGSHETSDPLLPILTFTGVADALWLLLVFYVNADAARRRMGRLWPTLLVIFVPVVGFIAYFLTRRPLAESCPSCGASARPGFAFCPGCGRSRASVCRSCRSPLDPDWAHCPACGASRSAQDAPPPEG